MQVCHSAARPGGARAGDLNLGAVRLLTHPVAQPALQAAADSRSVGRPACEALPGRRWQRAGGQFSHLPLAHPAGQQRARGRAGGGSGVRLSGEERKTPAAPLPLPPIPCPCPCPAPQVRQLYKKGALLKLNLINALLNACNPPRRCASCTKRGWSGWRCRCGLRTTCPSLPSRWAWAQPWLGLAGATPLHSCCHEYTRRPSTHGHRRERRLQPRAAGRRVKSRSPPRAGGRGRWVVCSQLPVPPSLPAPLPSLPLSRALSPTRHQLP